MWKWIMFIIAILGVGLGYVAYHLLYRNNIAKEKYTLYIASGSDYGKVLHTMQTDNVLIDKNSFEYLALKMGYSDAVKAGKYILKKGMSNKQLIQKLRSGDQDPVNVVIRSNIRQLPQLAGIIHNYLEIDSNTLMTLWRDSLFLHSYKTDTNNLIGRFIPNTYQIFWNTSAEKFMKRMNDENEKFWNDARIDKANDISLTREQVITLASIVEEETKTKSEKPRVAGVYINRLRKNMMLQADPTVKFAVGDFELKRILNEHLTTDSPYNTYKNYGLPPGPICVPTIESIDAVLEFEQHDYIYFCAKEDFSGLHNFAVTHAEHERNSKKFHDAMNSRGIK